MAAGAAVACSRRKGRIATAALAVVGGVGRCRERIFANCLMRRCKLRCAKLARTGFAIWVRFSPDAGRGWWAIRS